MLVSAIMPTRGRPIYAQLALGYFKSQTWAEKELVIVDDADFPSFPEGVSRPGVEYHRLPKRLTIGAKRNICCSRSRGEVIIHLDDDDWSAPGRFADQVNRLVESGKPVTAYNSMEFRGLSGCYRYDGHPIGSSLCYARDWWTRNPFQDRSLSEDGQFVLAAAGNITSVPAGDMMWASIHHGNTSARDLTRTEWTKL